MRLRSVGLWRLQKVTRLSPVDLGVTEPLVAQPQGNKLPRCRRDDAPFTEIRQAGRPRESHRTIGNRNLHTQTEILVESALLKTALNGLARPQLSAVDIERAARCSGRRPRSVNRFSINVERLNYEFEVGTLSGLEMNL